MKKLLIIFFILILSSFAQAKDPPKKYLDEKSKLNIQRDNGNIRAFSSKELEGFKLERAKRGRSLPQGYKRVLSITVERPKSTSN